LRERADDFYYSPDSSNVSRAAVAAAAARPARRIALSEAALCRDHPLTELPQITDWPRCSADDAGASFKSGTTVSITHGTSARAWPHRLAPGRRMPPNSNSGFVAAV
jgi:hypothetical protein